MRSGTLFLPILAMATACFDNSVDAPMLLGSSDHGIDDAPQVPGDDDARGDSDPPSEPDPVTDEDPGDPIVAAADPPSDPRDQPGVFLAVGYGGRRMLSSDGITWKHDQALTANGGDDQELLRTCIYADGQFVSLGWRLMTSPDGVAWTDRGVDAFGNWAGNVVYAEDLLVSLGGYGMRMSSGDGVHWSEHSIDTSATHPSDAVAYGAGTFVSTSDSGQRSYSDDGVTWHFVSAGDTTTPTYHLAYGDGVFVAVGDKQVLHSTDGKVWTAGTTLTVNAEGIVYAQGHFTVVGNGHAFVSDDGVHWDDHADASVPGAALTYGDGVYLAVGWQSIRRSTDGVHWTAGASTGSTNSLVTICFAPGVALP